MTDKPAISTTGLRVCVSFPKNVPKDPGKRAVFLTTKKWALRDLRIYFLEGSKLLQDRVLSVARQWEACANIRFIRSPDDDAEIRISFSPGGSWSYVGNDASTILPGEATMNFGWLNEHSDEVELRGVVLHEFGHALGLVHEHQHPVGGILWNKELVYAAYAGPPNFWTPQEVDLNILDAFSKDQTQFTTLDPTSIMVYPIDSRLTNGTFSAKENNALSEMDKAFIRQMYP